MKSARDGEGVFRRLAAARTDVPAPARLKSRIYSALMRTASEGGPLASLAESERAGHSLCVFEKAVRHLPVPASLETLNWCRVCHARVLAERLEQAPISWKGCPYAAFHKH